jgi:predicted cobalt transporter CbtA
VLLGGQAILGTSGAIAAPVPVTAHRTGPAPAARTASASVRDGQPHQQRQLPDAGFDGILVAAIGTGLTGTGWLLMLAGSRRLRRRSR